MSTLDSSMNSVSAAMVTDFYVRFRKSTTDKQQLRLARVLTAILGAVATATSFALATFEVGRFLRGRVSPSCLRISPILASGLDLGHLQSA